MFKIVSALVVIVALVGILLFVLTPVTPVTPVTHSTAIKVCKEQTFESGSHMKMCWYETYTSYSEVK